MNHQRLTRRLAAALAIAILSAAALGADDYRDDAGDIRTGKLSLRHEGAERNYYMYVPTNYTAEKKWPLIVSAPGTFPFDSSPGTRDAWAKVAEANGIIICCPDFVTATGLLNVKADQTKLDEDNKAVMAIVKQVRERYNIDPNGIAITGWSGGGYPAHYLGMKNPEVFRAIIGRTANFSEDLVDDETAGKARHLHVFCFFAKSDLAGIPEQNRRANFWYTTHGFLNFEIREVPGGHSKNNRLAAGWFMKLLDTWPTASIQASTLKGDAPLTVRFRALASDPDGEVRTTLWRFGDNSASIQPAPVHTFTEPKIYNVELTVIDDEGNQEYAQVDIEVR